MSDILKFRTKIGADIEKIWEVLTNPIITRQWFNTIEIITEWVDGADIIFVGKSNGKPFARKGKLLKVVKNRSIELLIFGPESKLAVSISIGKIKEDSSELEWLENEEGGFFENTKLFKMSDDILEKIKTASEKLVLFDEKYSF